MKQLLKNTTFPAVIVFTIYLFTHHSICNAAILPAPVDLLDVLSTYPTHPNEVLPIQPVLLYPKPRVSQYQGRNLEKDNDIIYVQLLKRKSYRPKKRPSADDLAESPFKELTMKDIFYVKALANGQFSHQRVKWYRLPEFYAISVYHKGETI